MTSALDAGFAHRQTAIFERDLRKTRKSRVIDCVLRSNRSTKAKADARTDGLLGSRL